MAVDEAGHHEVLGGAEDALEGTLRLQLGARPRRDDRGALQDEGAVGDERLLPQRDDRVAQDERATGGVQDGTTIRSNTSRNAVFASCRTFGSSIVVNARSS